MFVPFIEVFEEFQRGSWKYAISPDGEVYFGSIQGVDASKKCMLYGLLQCGDLNADLIWFPEWMFVNTAQELIEKAEIHSKEALKKAKKLTKDIESREWRKNDLIRQSVKDYQRGKIVS